MDLHLIYGVTGRSCLRQEELLGCDMCRGWDMAQCQAHCNVSGGPCTNHPKSASFERS